jgi:hypothetical protein
MTGGGRSQDTSKSLRGWLSTVLHRGVEVCEDVGGAFEVGGGDLAEVDGVVSGLHLAHYPAFEVGEGLFEERGSCLSGGVRRVAYPPVLVFKGLGELLGEVLLIGVQEVQGEDAGVSMRSWVCWSFRTATMSCWGEKET